MTTVESRRTKHPGGRPRKFPSPSRPITVTLPVETLTDLEGIDPDRAKAIVKATALAVHGADQTRKPVEMVTVGSGTGLIVIGPSHSLRRIPWLRVSEIAPTRYILSLQPGVSVDSLEVSLGDILESLPESDKRERELISQLRNLIQGLRRGHRVDRHEIILAKVPPGKG